MKEPITGNSRTAGAAGHCKMVYNRKANCCTLLKRITKLNCVNSGVKSVKHLPHSGRFPQVGPWHHVGVTMEITLDKNGSLYDPTGTES